MRLIVLLLFSLAAFGQQTNPACPGATAPSNTLIPRCVDLSWNAPATGTPTVYNVYRSTATGVCTWSNPTGIGTVTIPVGCVKIGTATPPATTYADLESASNILTEGATYFYVVSAANATGESGPSNEVSAKTLTTPLSNPTGNTGVPH